MDGDGGVKHAVALWHCMCHGLFQEQAWGVPAAWQEAVVRRKSEALCLPRCEVHQPEAWPSHIVCVAVWGRHWPDLVFFLASTCAGLGQLLSVCTIASVLRFVCTTASCGCECIMDLHHVVLGFEE